MLEVTAVQLIAEARSWIGTPYHHQARLKGVGVDCAGVPICVGRNLKLFPPEMDITHYARVPDGVSLIDHCNQWMSPIPIEDAMFSDIGIFRFAYDPQHLGILADYLHGGFSVIHSLDRNGSVRGSVIEHRLANKFKDNMIACYRIPGVVGQWRS